MRFKILIFLGFILIPFFVNAQSAGFLSDNIWYSKDPFFAGDKVRIYSAIFNSTEWDISGKVGFYDSQNLLGKAEFFVERNGNLSKTWIDWQIIEGEHKISARIEEARVTTQGFENVSLDFLNTKTIESVRYAYIDTDKDTVPDEKDTDDDNDGLLDDGEKKLGTDPKVKNTQEEFKQAENKQKQISEGNSVTEVKDPIYTTSEQAIKKVENKTITIFDKKIGEFEKKQEEIRLKTKEQENLDILHLILTKIFAKNGGEDINKKNLVKDLPVFNRIYYAALSAAIWSLKNRIIFYILALFIIYKIVRVILFKRKWSKL